MIIVKNKALAGMLILALGLMACRENKKEPKYPEPMRPDESMAHFQLNKDFKIETFAVEPNVLDPVDMVFDEQGNAYVVEMPDYPFPPEPGKEAGNIRMLIDANKDGKIDSAIVFADKLSEATSILPWKGGLICTAAPDILYLKDTTGDHKADIREVLFTGFFKANSEALITSLRFGVDNWIYANNRGQAGTVTIPGKPGSPALQMQGADFRFRLDNGKFELETGPGQFGQTINDWGHRFFTENTIHIQQSVIPWRYTHRHAFLKNPRAIINISDHDPIMFQETPPPYWRQARTDARNRNYKEQHLDRVEYADDHFTGASGGTVYEGDAYAKEYYGNIFTGEVAGNLVHRDVMLLNDSSAAYTATRGAAEKDREFLASTDSWFRPVGFVVGPDGCLYIIDYYRQHIETPVSIPDSLKTDMDFMRGSDMGRIYRVLPKEAGAYKPVNTNLAAMSSAELVGLLSHNNQWMRSTAHRLLLERQDKSVVPLLVKLVQESNDGRARLHALYVLESLSTLNIDLVKKAIVDPVAAVREHGLMLAEKYPACYPLILAAINDSSAKVALQAVLSLGEFNNPANEKAFATVLEKYKANQWFRTAVLSTDAGSSAAFMQRLLSSPAFTNEATADKTQLVEEITGIIAARNKKGETALLLNSISKANSAVNQQWMLAALKALSKAYRSPKALPIDAAMQGWLKKMSTEGAGAVKDSAVSLLSLSNKK